MRILFTVPHFFRAVEQGKHGSLKSDEQQRAASLHALLCSLHHTFGQWQALLKSDPRPANEAFRAEIKVVVCTCHGQHLLDRIPAELYEHHSTDCNPPLLGYECHSVLREHLGQFDFYCFIEDDLRFSDATFFQKIRWFQSFAGPERVLQPNRYEVTDTYPREKLYIDGPLAQPVFNERFQRPITQKQLVASHLGQDIVFQRLNNPHAGCFFLTEEQMRMWSSKPFFLDRSKEFVGPLESAATLGILRTFEIFKPARENAAFLEVRHLDNRYHGARVGIQERLRQLSG